MKTILIITIFIFGFGGGVLYTLNEPEAKAFDYSNCQYPERWSNPENGCDNSDPAVPECIKEMYTKEAEEACIDRFVKANTPVEQEVQKPVTIPEKTQIEPSECGK